MSHADRLAAFGLLAVAALTNQHDSGNSAMSHADRLAAFGLLAVAAFAVYIKIHTLSFTSELDTTGYGFLCAWLIASRKGKAPGRKYRVPFQYMNEIEFFYYLYGSCRMWPQRQSTTAAI